MNIQGTYIYYLRINVRLYVARVEEACEEDVTTGLMQWLTGVIIGFPPFPCSECAPHVPSPHSQKLPQ